MNAVFLHNTLFDGAALSLAGGAVDPAWPLANLQDTIRTHVAKFTGTGNVTINIDMGTEVTCSSLGLVEYDLKPAAPVIVRAFSDAWTTEKLRADFEAVGPILGWKSGTWKDFGWKGYPSTADLEELPKPASLFVFQAAYARYWSVEFQNGSDAADAFYLGRILLGLHWSPFRNFSFGYKLDLADTSITDQTPAGVKFTDEGDQYWIANVKFERLLPQEIWDGWLRFAKGVGTRKDFIVRLLDGTETTARMTTLYGRLTKDPGFTQARPQKAASAFTIEESL